MPTHTVKGKDAKTAIDKGNLESALKALYAAREQQLASLQERKDLPGFVREEMGDKLKSVRRQRARWEREHSGPATSA